MSVIVLWNPDLPVSWLMFSLPCSACPIASFRGGWEGGVWAMCPQLLLLRLGREGLRGSGEPVCDWLWVSSSGPSSEPDPLSRGHWALPWGQ